MFSIFNLDQLVPERFQELCCAILVNHFSPLILPHGRPGRDGGIDAELIGEAFTSYSEIINRPINSTASDGSKHTWIFQVKHIRQEGKKERQRAIIDAMKKEVEAWKKKRGCKPTHFFLLTNVNLKMSTKKLLKASGNYFSYFECWGEEKITSFVNGNVALQNAFFPSFSKLIVEVTKLTAIQENQSFIEDTSKLKSKKTKSRSIKVTKASFLSSIRKLVNYEISFLRTNDEFLGHLLYRQDKFKAPKNWIKIEVKSPKNGILILSEDQSALSSLINEVIQCNVGITFWERYLGEETQRGESITTLLCHPEKADLVRAATKKLFKVVQGENTAHLIVDEYLKELQSKILTDIKNNRITEAEEDLNELIAGRREYSRNKKQYPTAFYPNMRTLGIRPVFGWDFSNLWEDILTNIAEVAFSELHPKDLYHRLIRAPFHLCIEAIRNKLPEERFQAELAATHVILRVISDKKNEAHLKCFLDNLDDLTTAVGDIEHQIESKEDAEWAVAITRVVTRYIAELGKLALSKKIDLSFDSLLPFIYKSTSLQFQDLRYNTKKEFEDWQVRYDLQKFFEGQIYEIRCDFLFALATYSWFLERKKGSHDPSLALSLLKEIPAKLIIDLYQLKLDGKNDWFNWWFNPEGKRTMWSSKVDHDIRESIQLAILNVPIIPQDLCSLQLLEVESSYKEFIGELEQLKETLSNIDHKPSNDFIQVKKILDAARNLILDILNDRIRQSSFSEDKLKTIQDSFLKKIKHESPEGVLYLLEEGSVEEVSYYIGTNLIHDKISFLENTGFMGYSVCGMGEQCADNILFGREQLLVEAISGLVAVEMYELEELDVIINSLKETGSVNTVLLTSPISIPWHYWNKYLEREHQYPQQEVSLQPGRVGRLGEIDVYYNRHMKNGEFLLIPKASFVWRTIKRLLVPKIEVIDPYSGVGKKIAEQYKSMDLTLKCLVDAREEGIMRFQGDTKAIRFLQPSVHEE